jgi:hypothetical protein
MYNNLLNMGEPVNVPPLPQMPTASPFSYTDKGLLPISIPSYSAPTANPYTPVQPGLFGDSIAPIAPITSRRRYDTNAMSMEDMENAGKEAGEMEPTVDNIASVIGNLVSFALNPGLTVMGVMSNTALGRNDRSFQSLFSQIGDFLSGNYGGYDGRGNYGTSGTDEAGFTDAGITSSWDAFGADFDTAAALSSYDVDPSFGYEDISQSDVGGTSDADADDAGGFGGDSDW